jgi:hypothetical protein
VSRYNKPATSEVFLNELIGTFADDTAVAIAVFW